MSPTSKNQKPLSWVADSYKMQVDRLEKSKKITPEEAKKRRDAIWRIGYHIRIRFFSGTQAGRLYRAVVGGDFTEYREVFAFLGEDHD